VLCSPSTLTRFNAAIITSVNRHAFRFIPGMLFAAQPAYFSRALALDQSRDDRRYMVLRYRRVARWHREPRLLPACRTQPMGRPAESADRPAFRGQKPRLLSAGRNQPMGWPAESADCPRAETSQWAGPLKAPTGLLFAGKSHAFCPRAETSQWAGPLKAPKALSANKPGEFT
jgi:hypothetical protein